MSELDELCITHACPVVCVHACNGSQSVSESAACVCICIQQGTETTRGNLLHVSQHRVQKGSVLHSGIASLSLLAVTILITENTDM